MSGYLKGAAVTCREDGPFRGGTSGAGGATSVGDLGHFRIPGLP